MNQDLAIFQHLLERMVRYLPLQDAVKEVSRHATKNYSKLGSLWLKFVYRHPHFSDEVLRILARDEKRDVRGAVARREQDIPRDVLKSLAQDENRWVRIIAKGN